MRLDIRYLTRFRYSGSVSESQNELRACPSTDDHQQLVHYHVTTLPSSRVASYYDYWGTRVDTFGVRLPHELLEVVAEATVETFEPAVAPTDVPLDVLLEPAFRDAHQEFLQRSPHVDWGSELAVTAQGLRASASDVVGLVHAVHEQVASLEYRSGETYVGVGVDAVFAAGAGVCQDFAHLAIAMYRELRIPARYVSGYLFTVDDATGVDSETDEVQVETHAWVEVAVPDFGWLALDPTNAQAVGERHVSIGRGRDYDDVSPFRGVFSGPGSHELEVSVTMRRLALEPLGDVQGVGRRRRGVAQPVLASGEHPQSQQ